MKSRPHEDPCKAPQNSFAFKLSTKRREKKVTKYQMGILLDQSPGNVRRIELGKASVSEKTVNQYARALKMRAYLVIKQINPPPIPKTLRGGKDGVIKAPEGSWAFTLGSFRQKLKITQSQQATLMGLRRATFISKIDQGKGALTEKTVHKYIQALGAEVSLELVPLEDVQ